MLLFTSGCPGRRSHMTRHPKDYYDETLILSVAREHEKYPSNLHTFFFLSYDFQLFKSSDAKPLGRECIRGKQPGKSCSTSAV